MDALVYALALWRLSRARPEQLAPDEWRMWLMMTGRAWGKTLAAVWWIVEEIVKTYDPGQGKCSAPQRIGIVAPTRQSLFDTALHGPTGLLVQAPEESWQWEDRSRVWIRFGCGCRVFGYSAEAPARLRGPGLDKAWADELAAWPNLGAEEKEDAWSLLAPTLRESESPRIVVTTTPKPIKLLTDIIERQGTHLQQGATWDNTALSPEVIALIRDTYRGRIDEEQELEGKLLTESPFALWKQADIDLAERLGSVPPADMGRVVVAVDPSISAGGFAAECGIVICAQVKGSERLVVVDDLSGRMDPEVWGQAVHNACRTYDCPAVVEDNQGGAMVHQVINQDPAKRRVPVLTVHASESKRERAIPVAALYGRGQVGHARRFAQLNGELTAWDPSKESPNRLDALVHGLRELLGIRPRKSNIGRVLD